MWTNSLTCGISISFALRLLHASQFVSLSECWLPLKNLSPKAVFTELVQRTFVIGIEGTTNTIIERVMKSIMTYECGSYFCYVALNEDKVAFETSTIYDIVIVCKVHKSMIKDEVESKIKNWLCHFPSYAFKNNEDEKINGKDELRQNDSDY
ncbi:hypothetical protein GHT06_018685 [Daphnia sinensis]|uniref:Uncharacterized protein n=1 Tax=Daphnia sinensis TaxID=1820382 RepID=A0AAD5LEB4_9CRUS|nr:hypothetical protein GHT06_018685 [Daphnia sinensis]